MGRILTIRLSAGTYNEEDVCRAWPKLCALAWPGMGEVTRNGWKKTPAAFAPPVAPEPKSYGVMDLVHNLAEELRFGDWDTELKNRLKDGLNDLGQAAAKLEKALGDWQPQAANAATDDIEDALDKLERELA